MSAKPRCSARCGNIPCGFPIEVEIVIPGAGLHDDPDAIELCGWHGKHLGRLFGLVPTPLKQSHPERVKQ